MALETGQCFQEGHLMKRLFDIALALGVAILLSPLLLLIALLVKLTSQGSVLYWSDRVGAAMACFRCPSSARCGPIRLWWRPTC